MEILSGVIHGNIIELASVPSVADGERVIVTIQPAKNQSVLDARSVLPGTPPKWQQGKTVGGCLADVWTDEDDSILAEIEHERQNATFREVNE
jgi:hypothetical protein